MFVWTVFALICTLTEERRKQLVPLLELSASAQLNSRPITLRSHGTVEICSPLSLSKIGWPNLQNASRSNWWGIIILKLVPFICSSLHRINFDISSKLYLWASKWHQESDDLTDNLYIPYLRSLISPRLWLVFAMLWFVLILHSTTLHEEVLVYTDGSLASLTRLH